MTVTATLLALCLWTDANAVQAQQYPSRPIKIVIGTSVDVFSRIIGEQLYRTWGQPVVIELRPGAGGSIAATTVSTAAPDGHTLLFATPTYTLNTALNLASYDLLKDFEPVSLVTTGTYVLFVHPSVPAKSVAELAAFAKAQPGGISCASPGIGTAPHLACEMFSKAARANVVHVPYRNVMSAMAGMLSGDAEMSFAVSPIAAPQMQSGTVRGLAVTAEQRSPFLPDLPTMAESGFANFVMQSWGGFLAPAETPREVVQQLNTEIQRVVKMPDVQQRLAALGGTRLPPYTPAEVGAFLKNDIARWSRLVQVTGLEKLRKPDAAPR
jgi:tripartite-type tricarboxylate transporter receptor subunit TctC